MASDDFATRIASGCDSAPDRGHACRHAGTGVFDATTARHDRSAGRRGHGLAQRGGQTSSRPQLHVDAYADVDRLGVEAYDDVDALIAASDAVAIAVTPDAQPDLAVRRAPAAGKPMLLEKPLADDLAGAQRIVAAVEQAGVGTLVMLTYRFHPGLQRFAEAAAGFDALGGRGCFLSGAFLPGSPYARGWRLERARCSTSARISSTSTSSRSARSPTSRPRVDRHGWVALNLEHAVRRDEPELAVLSRRDGEPHGVRAVRARRSRCCSTGAKAIVARSAPTSGARSRTSSPARRIPPTPDAGLHLQGSSSAPSASSDG